MSGSALEQSAFMANNLLRTSFSPAALQPAEEQARLAWPITLPQFAFDESGHTETLAIPDYRAIAYILPVPLKKSEDGASYTPLTDLNEDLHRGTTIPVPVPNRLDRFEDTSLVVMTSGESMLVWGEAADLMRKLEDAQRDFRRHRLDDLARRKGTEYTMALAQNELTSGVMFHAVNPENLQSEQLVYVRDYKSLQDGEIIALAWNKNADGTYSPDETYGEAISSDKSYDAAHLPGDSRDHLPPSLLRFADGRQMLSWQKPDEIADRIADAAEKAAKELRAQQQSCDVYNGGPTLETQPQLQEQPKPKPRELMTLPETEAEEELEEWQKEEALPEPSWR